MTNLILQPATFLNVISNFTIIGQLHDGWNYRKLPKTMIFSKSPRNAAVLNPQDGRNSSPGTKAKCDCSRILAKGGPGSTYVKGCQAYCRQKSNKA